MGGAFEIVERTEKALCACVGVNEEVSVCAQPDQPLPRQVEHVTERRPSQLGQTTISPLTGEGGNSFARSMATLRTVSVPVTIGM